MNQGIVSMTDRALLRRMLRPGRSPLLIHPIVFTTVTMWLLYDSGQGSRSFSGIVALCDLSC
jgi:hypothetical protein